MGSSRHGGQGRHILARQLDEVGAEHLTLQRHAGDVARRVLDAGNVGQVAQALHGFDRHVDDRSTRYVVDDDRKGDRIADGFEMAEKAFLAGLVIVGGNDQNGIRADLFGMAGEVDRLGGVVRSRARHHRHPAPRLGDADLDDPSMLVVAKCRAFARGAAGHQPVRAALDLPIDQGPESRLIDAATAERGHQGGQGAFQP